MSTLAPSSLCGPIAFALFVWWFSTGAIIFLDNLPRHTFRWTMLGATLLLAGSLAALPWIGADASLKGAYAGFTAGMLAWAWIEVSFYTGFVTGPRKAICRDGCSGWRHFLHAVGASLWHELAILALVGAVCTLSAGAPNQIALWTVLVLWWMHQSAKLNVLLGVPNLSEELLPAHLAFLRPFLTRKPMNLLFPVSVTVSTVFAAVLVQRAAAYPVGSFGRTGLVFTTTLMVLAIIEHWFLVVPLPSSKLWHWGLKSRQIVRFDIEIVAGFLGAGKTTWLRHRLSEAGPRSLILVNDFASVCLDASLLDGRGAEVVELPNGCICCSLRHDLAHQLRTVVGLYAPDRVLIEPSGVADLAGLLAVLEQADIAPLLAGRQVETVVDASTFLADYARMESHLAAQLRLASRVVVSKVDLVGPATIDLVEHTIACLNPKAELVRAVHGVTVATRRPAADAVAVAAACGHSHHEPALGLASWSAALVRDCDPQRLRALLEAIAAGTYGQVERIKGIARSGGGWVHFDVAGGRPSMAAFAPRRVETGRVLAIGRGVDEAGLAAAFAGVSAS